MSERQGERRLLRAASGLCTFALIGLFAVLSALLVAIGVQGYQQVNLRARDTAQARTAAGYLRNKVRTSDEVSVETVGGVQALVLRAAEDASYQTLVYVSDGALREAYREDGDDFDPEFGERIVAAADFSVALDGGLCRMRVTDEQGRATDIAAALRGGE